MCLRERCVQAHWRMQFASCCGCTQLQGGLHAFLTPLQPPKTCGTCRAVLFVDDHQSAIKRLLQVMLGLGMHPLKLACWNGYAWGLPTCFVHGLTELGGPPWITH